MNYMDYPPRDSIPEVV